MSDENKCPQCGMDTTRKFTPIEPHNDVSCLTVQLERMKTLAEDWKEAHRVVAETAIKTGTTLARVTEAMLPSARLVWENGGYSGSSGNWPLVAAYDKLAPLEQTDPELYARIREKP
jgi:hypothetical protein